MKVTAMIICLMHPWLSKDLFINASGAGSCIDDYNWILGIYVCWCYLCGSSFDITGTNVGSFMMKFKLCAGVWEWWVRNKDTREPVSPRLYIGELIKNETEISLDIPEHLQSPDNEIYVQRTR